MDTCGLMLMWDAACADTLTLSLQRTTSKAGAAAETAEIQKHSIIPTAGLQEWFTDFDGWVCSFTGNLSVSRISTSQRDENANSDQTCRDCTDTNEKKQNEATQPSSETLALHEIIVNGLLIAKRKEQRRKNTDLLNFFKDSEDFTHIDFVLLSTVKENVSKNIDKYILRSKI